MDDNHSDGLGPPYPQGAPTRDREEVDEILRRKRKAREYKACYPCRQRKVKCDQTVPCKTCVSRAHPELCTYHPPSGSHRLTKRPTFDSAERVPTEYHNGPVYGNGLGATITIPRDDWDRIQSKLNSVQKTLHELRSAFSLVGGGSRNSFPPSEFSPGDTSSVGGDSKPAMDPSQRHISLEGLHTRNEFTGEVVHIGGSSIPALVMALGRGSNNEVSNYQDILGKSILPLFGLDNESATYPFVDLWGLPHASMARVHELCRALPVDSECLSFFRYYKDTAHVIYPGIVDIDKFEQDLLLFLINRASMQPNTDGDNGINEQMIYGQPIVWVGMLFAALASGVQCTALPRKERELSSQVFVCCSFECLRFTNFLSSTNLEGIQTLLLLGNVLSNNMNAGVAWSLLGLTIRLAQTLGLHRTCPSNTPLPIMIIRSRVWWALVWQDSLLSVTFDRASSSTTWTADHYPPGPTSTPGNRSYEECMYRLCRVGLDIVRDRASPQNSNEALLRITEHRNELQDIMFEAADYLRDSRRCRSIRDQLEHWALYLHISHITSELCRPAISPSTAQYDLSRTLRRTCIDSLANTVEAFLGLQNVTPFACRSWAAVHRSLSSALLLGLLREPLRNDRVRTLLEKITSVLSEVTSTIDPAELTAPITRSITALRKLLHANTIKLRDTPRSDGYDGSPVTNGQGMGNLSFEDGVDISPLLNLDLSDSPYAMMDSILWGGKRTP